MLDALDLRPQPGFLGRDTGYGSEDVFAAGDGLLEGVCFLSFEDGEVGYCASDSAPGAAEADAVGFGLSDGDHVLRRR